MKDDAKIMPIMSPEELDVLLAVARGEVPTETGKKQNFDGEFTKFLTRLMENILEKKGLKAGIEKHIISIREIQRFDRYRKQVYMLLALGFVVGRKSVAENPVDHTFKNALKAIPPEDVAELRAEIAKHKTKKKKLTKSSKSK